VLRPPIQPMLAKPVRALPPPEACAGGCAYEPKFDGWRCLVFSQPHGVYLQSRAGRPLAGYFPEIARVCHQVLPADMVIDGELVVWEPERGRTSFTLLQRRVSAGRRVLRLAIQHPAHLVVFDLVQADGQPLLDTPLAHRRARLAALLAAAPAQLALCPQTTQPGQAIEWLTTWTGTGVEGLIIKGLASRYQPGRRGWSKYRSTTTTEAIIAGVIGSTGDPHALLLGRFDHQNRLRYVGRTHPLKPAQRADLAGTLTPATRWRRGAGIDHPWPRPLPASWTGQLGATGPINYHQVEPTVVAEVRVDTAGEHGRWRHMAHHVRIRADMSIYDVPLVGTDDQP
jgi:ATP-dependent DNA ligase